jgi:hypothetical protein
MKSIFRTTDIVLIAVMVGTAAVTYKLKHDTQERLAEIRKIQTQIRYEEDTIDLLKADWSLLIQPARIQKLAEHYGSELPLQPLDAHQMVALTDIPLKPPPPPDAVANLIDEIAGAAPAADPITTGGTAR